MKHILISLFLFISIPAIAQISWLPQPYNYQYKRAIFDSSMRAPVLASNRAFYTNKDSVGLIWFNSDSAKLFARFPGNTIRSIVSYDTLVAVKNQLDPVYSYISNSIRNAPSIAGTLQSNGAIVFVGNSISEGYGTSNVTNSWPNVLTADFQKYTNTPASNIAITNFDDTTRYSFHRTGVWSIANTGPIGKAITLNPGASITFSGAFNYVDVWFKQAAGTGTLDFYRNGILYRTHNCSGSTANNLTFSPDSTTSSGVSASYEIKARGAAVTITNLIQLLGTTQPTALYFQRSALGGITTAYPLSYLADLKEIVALDGANTLQTFIISLGTNDIYNPSNALPVISYKANLISLFSYIKDLRNNVIYIFPPHTTAASTYQPVLDTYDNYLKAARRVCDSMGIQMIDFSTYNFDKLSFYDTDGLHPNNAGATAWAKYVEGNIANAQPSFDGGNSAPATGGPGYIQNQTSSVQTAGYDINGTGRVGGDFTGGSGIRSTGTASFAAGAGTEIANTGTLGYVFSYNRSTSTALPLAINSFGGNVGIGTASPNSILNISGSVAYSMRTVTATATLGEDHYLNVNNSSDVIVNLPSVTGISGRTYVVKKISNNANTVTITPAAGTIDGSATVVLSSFNSSVTVATDGSNWFVY